MNNNRMNNNNKVMKRRRVKAPQSNRNTIRRNPNINRRGRINRSQNAVRGARLQRSNNAPIPGNLVRFNAPRQSTSNNQSRIIHREPLGTVNGSVGFGITTYQLNPGLASTFPWLSAQAAGYESYKVNKLAIEYKFTTNEFVGLGRLVIAPDYDASDSAPTTIVQAEQMADSVMGAVAKNWTCILRPRGIGILGPKRYTRNSTLSPNQDIKTYDIAQVHIITQGQADTTEIGQLWVSYDITFCEPQPISDGNILSAGSIENPTGTGALTTDLLGSNNNIEGSLVISHVLNVITIRNLIPGQAYQFKFHEVAAVVTNAPTFTFGDGFTSINNSEALTTLNGGTTNGWALDMATANQSTGVVTLGGTTVLTTPSRILFSVSGCTNYSD